MNGDIYLSTRLFRSRLETVNDMNSTTTVERARELLGKDSFFSFTFIILWWCFLFRLLYV